MRILAYAGRIGPDRAPRTNDRPTLDVDEVDEDRDALAIVVGLRDRRTR